MELTVIFSPSRSLKNKTKTKKRGIFVQQNPCLSRVIPMARTTSVNALPGRDQGNIARYVRLAFDSDPHLPRQSTRSTHRSTDPLTDPPIHRSTHRSIDPLTDPPIHSLIHRSTHRSIDLTCCVHRPLKTETNCTRASSFCTTPWIQASHC